MKSGALLVCVLLSGLVGACGGEDKGSSTSSSGGSSSGTTSSSGDPPSGGSSSGGADAGTPPTASAGPKITQIMKMTGGLHVVWELPTACDGVELERKDGSADYKVVYTLPGTVDNKHDGKATADMLYTYRARCKVGAAYTSYSNEMGKNPI